MGQKAITVYTPISQDPHIMAGDDAFIFADFAGIENGILGALICVAQNSTTARLAGGGAINRGHIIRIPDGDVLDLIVESAQTTRYDSVVAEFVRGNDDDIADTYAIKIIQGNENPPTLAKSELLNAGDVNQVELFRLAVGDNGFTVTQIADKIQDVQTEKISRYTYKKQKKVQYNQAHAAVYGIMIDKNNSDPSARITYTDDAEGMTPAHMDFQNGVFDYGDWENAFFVKNNRPVMLSPDRTVAYELNHNDYSKKLDGTASDIYNTATNLNAMSEFPIIWLCQYEVGDYEYILVSNVQINDNYNAYAYTCADGKIAKYMYLPIYGGSFDGSKIRSLSNKPLMTDETAQTEMNYAAANGDGWTIIPWCRRNLINSLLLIIGKSENTKSVFGRGNVQGLGKILNSGELDKKGQFYGYSDTTHQVKIFHIEKWWGDRYDRIVGMISHYGIAKVKMSPPYNLTGAGYIDTLVNFPSSNGQQKDTRMTEYGRFPITVGASTSTYTCSHIWISSNITAIAIAGGMFTNNDYASANTIALNSSAGIKGYYCGASLSCESQIDDDSMKIEFNGIDESLHAEIDEFKNDRQIATMNEYLEAINF